MTDHEETLEQWIERMKQFIDDCETYWYLMD